MGEFVDVLDNVQQEGLAHAAGASNWTRPRFEAANHYATRHDRRAMAALSNQFSLAQWMEVPWPGCQTAADPDFRTWLTGTQTPLLAWSSQARGFFARADRRRRDDAELVRCWYSEANFGRLDRARRLAIRRQVTPTALALAYVLRQPFPTFALIGPKSEAELQDSLKALDVGLTEDDLQWLNLEAPAEEMLMSSARSGSSVVDGRGNDPVRWGILGTGNMARRFVTALAASRTGTTVAFGTRSSRTGGRFRAQVGPIRCHVGYESLLGDAEVEAVYVALPNSLHRAAAVAAACAGKHVLCEKPLTVAESEALEIIDAARKSGVFLMEAMMYRCHPQIGRIVQLVRAGAIGQPALIDVTVGYQAVFAPGRRVFSRELGGGCILDVGCYGVSVMQQIAGAGTGQPWVEPLDVKGAARMGSHGVDELALGIFVFDEILARVSVSITLAQSSRLQVLGTDASILVEDPFRPAYAGGGSSFALRDRSGRTEQVVTHSDRPLLALEADVAGSCIRQGLRSSPLLTPAESVATTRTLARWRSAAGLT